MVTNYDMRILALHQPASHKVREAISVISSLNPFFDVAAVIIITILLFQYQIEGTAVSPIL